MGVFVGEIEGDSVGERDGAAVVGCDVVVGDSLGPLDALGRGDTVGSADGATEGPDDGATDMVGTADGFEVMTRLGCPP